MPQTLLEVVNTQMRTLKILSLMAITQHIQGKFLLRYSILNREILDNKYLILRKLGWGHFSTVWLAIKI